MFPQISLITNQKYMSDTATVMKSITPYHDALAQAGMVWSGLSPDYRLVETGKLRAPLYVMGRQFRPELMSRSNTPYPLFRQLLSATNTHNQRCQLC